MHCVVQKKNFGASNASYLLFITDTVRVRQKENDELRSWPTTLEWQTQWPPALSCAAQLRSAVCSDATPSCFPLLPQMSVSLCERARPAWRDVLQSTPTASSTHNCACLRCSSVCVTFFIQYSVSYMFTSSREMVNYTHSSTAGKTQEILFRFLHHELSFFTYLVH